MQNSDHILITFSVQLAHKLLSNMPAINLKLPLKDTYTEMHILHSCQSPISRIKTSLNKSCLQLPINDPINVRMLISRIDLINQNMF